VEGKPIPGFRGQQTEQRINKHTRQVESERTVAEYLHITVSNRVLIVKVPPGTPESQQQFTGALVDMPEKLRADAAQALNKANLDFQEVYLPFMLDATGFRGAGYWGLAIGLPLYIIAVWNIVKALRRMQRLERHPAVRYLAAYGEPAELAQSIDQELEKDRLRVSGVTLTSSWLLQPTTYSLHVIPLLDVIWVYKKVTKHSVNFIPTGSSYAAVINTRYRQTLEVAANERLTNNLLEEIGRRVPWVVAGHSNELAGIYAKDVAGLAAAVDDRRQQFLDGMRQQSSEQPEQPGST
jgi:hypothetical protein